MHLQRRAQGHFPKPPLPRHHQPQLKDEVPTSTNVSEEHSKNKLRALSARMIGHSLTSVVLFELFVLEPKQLEDVNYASCTFVGGMHLQLP